MQKCKAQIGYRSHEFNFPEERMNSYFTDLLAHLSPTTVRRAELGEVLSALALTEVHI